MIRTNLEEITVDTYSAHQFFCIFPYNICAMSNIHYIHILIGIINETEYVQNDVFSEYQPETLRL